MIEFRIDSLDPEEVAKAILYSRPKDRETLVKIYENFGGFKAFTERELSDPLKRLRNALFRSKAFPADIHQAVFEATVKIGRYDAYDFYNRTYIFTDFARFMRIWKVNKTVALYFFTDESMMTRDEWFAADTWEELPMVHDSNCRGDEPGNLLAHYFCKTVRLFHADRNLAFSVENKRRLDKLVAPEIINLIQETILQCSTALRSSYATSCIVRDDHWALLAADPKRDVLNAVAANVFLPTEIAEFIVRSHKTASLREAIARNTTSNELLNMIWKSTTSESIRNVVERNPLFVKFF